MHPKVTVVIPFYQQQSGILARALDSVSCQQGGLDPEVVVVDDSSPAPVEPELAGLGASARACVRVVRQRNGGPASARNRGLSEVGAGVEYVAFLDSDDAWSEDHLLRAVTALEQGYDFYFADHYQLGQSVGAFARAGRIRSSDHPELSEGSALHAYRGDMFDQILRGNVIGTSTVVYRFEKFADLRFREEFVYAGEDYLFWMSLVKRTDRIAFSSRVECTYGRGVNVFSGSGWGTERSLIRLHYELKYHKAIPRLYGLNAAQAADNRQVVGRLRKSFVRDVLHRIANRLHLDARTLREQFKHDPQTYLLFLPITLGLVIDTVRRQPKI